MILAAIQYKPPKGQTQVARTQLAELVTDAAQNGADIIVCPEMAISGYIWSTTEEIWPHTEEAAGETYQLLSSIAEKYRVWVICGIAEREGKSLYNSAIVISSNGELICCYRKILLYKADHTWAQAGQQRMIIQTEHGRIAPAICMDLNDNKLLYWLWREQPDILAFCTNWLDEGSPIDDYWKLRTFHWSGWMVGANCWGEDNGTTFRGESAILDTHKRTRAKAALSGDCIIYCDTSQ